MIRLFRIVPFALIAVIALSSAAACGDDGDDAGPAATAGAPTATSSPAAEGTPSASGGFALTSASFGDNETMPVQHTCDGANTSPPLAISGAPDGAASLALTTIDIDGPGGAFVHWTVWNIDPATTDVAQDAVPPGGVEGLTGRGTAGYFGPCPPSGTHRYVFTLHALDMTLELDPVMSGNAELQAAIEGHVLASAVLTGLYTR